MDFVSAHCLLVFFWISLRDLIISSLRMLSSSCRWFCLYISCASAMLSYFGPAVIGQLGTSRNRFLRVLLIVFLHWHLGFWDFDDIRSRSQFLIFFIFLFFLVECLVPWFPPPVQICRECDGCLLPGRKLSLNLIVLSTGRLQVKCISVDWEQIFRNVDRLWV